MARVLITGSTAGLGLAAARSLLDEGHEVVLHARNSARVQPTSLRARRASPSVTSQAATRRAPWRIE
jgi:NAD(P)-dependent dehydrogenase (short-subunit alcohol dehydrogenase family)